MLGGALAILLGAAGRRSEPTTYSEWLDALGVVRHFRLNASGGIEAVDRKGGADGTYVNTPHLGLPAMVEDDGGDGGAIGLKGGASPAHLTVQDFLLSGPMT